MEVLNKCVRKCISLRTNGYMCRYQWNMCEFYKKTCASFIDVPELGDAKCPRNERARAASVGPCMEGSSV